MSTGVKKVMADQADKQAEIVSTPADPSAERGHRDRDRGRRRHRNQDRNPVRHLEQSVNMTELRELVGLITDNSLTLLELEREGFRVKIGRGPFYEEAAPNAAAQKQLSGAPAPPAGGVVQSVPTFVPPHPGAQAEEAASVDQDLHIITSPIVGTFYRAPSPTADSFVRIGSQVEPTTVVCIIEAMKLMNEIQAEAIGEVVKIYVENGQAVEYGQPLFGIKAQ